MSTKDPNMKVIFGSDTSDFEKGAKQVKQGLKDLDKSSTDVLSSIGNAFGVDTRKVEQMTSAVRGLGQKMSESGNLGVSAFGNILKAIGPVGGAIAGLGIGAAVAGFKSLKDEAEAFKNTVQGANIEMATAVYVDTYKQILRDFDGDVGKALAQTESNWKKFWTQTGQAFKQMFRTGAWMGVNTPGGVEALDEYARRMSAANTGAQEAERLTNEIYNLERKRKTQAVELARINDQIATAINTAKDATVSLADRNAAISTAESLIAQKKEKTVGIEAELSRLYTERAAIASNTVAAEDAMLAQQAREYEASRAITQEETALLRIKNSIGRASEAEIARMKKLIEQQKALEKAIEETRAKWSGLGTVSTEGLSSLQGGVTGPAMKILPQRQDVELFKSTFQAYLGDWEIAIGFKADTEKIHDITREVTSLMESSLQRTGELIGGLIGTLAGGGDAWGDFKSAALSAFGDMAIAVGKIAISMGVAAAGIDAALKDTGQWYIAVAAGVALVALGAAVKSSLSAVASGDYSAAGGGGYAAGSTSSSSSGNYEAREVKVYVTGSLEADGDKLIAVINNANKKNYFTK